ncbi:uncharacterized protein [Rutidosis leptorrhynchoides]|uniref:uncharacterized protein n=1 Tax=Rutidosis leptorrhynchoides TaxID=125765 RepID=UPI003A9A1430
MASNPSRVSDKFQERDVPCVFLGYPPHQKGYKLYNLQTHSTFVSRDVKFFEHIFPYSAQSIQRFLKPLPTQLPNTKTIDFSIYEHIHDEPNVINDANQESTNSGLQEQEDHAVNISQPQSTTSNLRRSTRTASVLHWHKYYVFSDPTNFKEAIVDVGWTNTMNDEMQGLENNETWEVTELPEGKKAIDTFAPVAKIVTVRSLLAVAAMFNWKYVKWMYPMLFCMSKADYSLFTKKNNDQFTAILVYVDDLLITRNSVDHINQLKI